MISPPLLYFLFTNSETHLSSSLLQEQVALKGIKVVQIDITQEQERLRYFGNYQCASTVLYRAECIAGIDINNKDALDILLSSTGAPSVPMQKETVRDESSNQFTFHVGFSHEAPARLSSCFKKDNLNLNTLPPPIPNKIPPKLSISEDLKNIQEKTSEGPQNYVFQKKFVQVKERTTHAVGLQRSLSSIPRQKDKSPLVTPRSNTPSHPTLPVLKVNRISHTNLKRTSAVKIYKHRRSQSHPNLSVAASTATVTPTHVAALDTAVTSSQPTIPPLRRWKPSSPRMSSMSPRGVPSGLNREQTLGVPESPRMSSRLLPRGIPSGLNREQTLGVPEGRAIPSVGRKNELENGFRGVWLGRTRELFGVQDLESGRTSTRAVLCTRAKSIKGILSLDPKQLTFSPDFHQSEWSISLVQLLQCQLMNVCNDGTPLQEDEIVLHVEVTEEKTPKKGNSIFRKLKRDDTHEIIKEYDFIIRKNFSQIIYGRIKSQIMRSKEQAIGRDLNLDFGCLDERSTLGEDAETDVLDLLDKSSILDKIQIKKLYKYLPFRFRNDNLKLLFSTDYDGSALQSFYVKSRDQNATLLIVKDSEGFVFGYFSTEEWHHDKNWYGTGESFLWSLKPQFNVYKWTKSNEYYQFSDPSTLIMGGGTRKQEEFINDGEHLVSGFYGLWIDRGLGSGTSHMSDTYFNRPLAATEEFRIDVLELWGFTSMTID